VLILFFLSSNGVQRLSWIVFWAAARANRASASVNGNAESVSGIGLAPETAAMEKDEITEFTVLWISATTDACFRNLRKQ
jgi:hypothetical protein